MMTPKKLNFKLLILACLGVGLSACGTANEVINHQANDQRLLKPAALDGGMAALYDTYSFSFLNKYRVSHDYISTDKCHYANDDTKSIRTKRQLPYYGYDFIYETLPIYEKNDHTLQGYPTDPKPKTLDQYTRPEFANGTDSHGNVRMAKGFQPICNQSWYLSQHVIEIELRKQNIDELMDAARKYDSTLVFESRKVNGNQWHVRFSELGLAPLNGAGGPFQTWLLPIGDTGYTFIFGLGANQDSLKYPQAHAQIQAIFKHLIESVKIDLLPLAK